MRKEEYKEKVIKIMEETEDESIAESVYWFIRGMFAAVAEREAD